LIIALGLELEFHSGYLITPTLLSSPFSQELSFCMLGKLAFRFVHISTLMSSPSLFGERISRYSGFVIGLSPQIGTDEEENGAFTPGGYLSARPSNEKRSW